MVQLSHPYMTAGKTIALTIQTFAGKMFLLFKTLSRFVIAFLSRSKCLLISWLQSPSTMILKPKKIKSATVSIFFLSIFHEVMEPNAMILVFECWALSKPFHSLISPSSRDSGSSSLFFAFISVALGDWPKKTLVRFMSENVLPMFSFRSILVSCLLFKPTWVYFCACVWECANFIDLHMTVQFSQCHLLKRLSSIVYSCFL